MAAALHTRSPNAKAANVQLGNDENILITQFLLGSEIHLMIDNADASCSINQFQVGGPRGR
jgi:hypothetical protein